MNKHNFYSIVMLFFIMLFYNSLIAQTTLTKYVDPFIGTGGHGHTYPGATLPFGMVQLSPDTGTEGWDWCSGYHYSDNSIMGFSHTHLSGTGATDYADILFMPTVGEIKIFPGSKESPDEGYRSRFSHNNEKASPGYYSVYLDDYKIKAELTTTERCGFHKYAFPKSNKSNIIIDLNHGLDSHNEGYIRVIDSRRIEGMRKSSGWAKDHTFYFYAEFSKPFKVFNLYKENRLADNSKDVSGKNIKAAFRFSTDESEIIYAKVGISAVDIEGARKNLEVEISHFNFEKIVNEANEKWENELSKIIVEGGTEIQKKIFYTALYHTLITPTIFSDVDGRYLGMDRKIHKKDDFDYYTVFSLWDTFRALHPLLTIIDQKRTRDFVKTLLAKYKESGLLPVWELASNETWTMIGYHSVPVIFDAYMKGINDFDLGLALEAMRKSADRDQHGLKLYRERGFIPADKENESVSKTLEYGYDDWCIAQFAKQIGEEDDFKKYNARSLFYKNLFDTSTGFFRGKLSNGKWIEPFNPKEVNAIYTEASAWQYNFFVPHDIKGLINLHGGNNNFIKKLDEMFEESDLLEGRHQPDITGLIGQYAHGNEPSHHVAYLYNYAGAPWKTQSRVRNIINSLYTDQPDGLCGNDDCGQLSAWYIFSAIGFYPVCPGDNKYMIGSPLFEKITIRLENGNKFIINAKNQSDKNIYVRSATLNGVNFNAPHISHQQIMEGGSINFVMSDLPNYQRGTDLSGLFEMVPEKVGVEIPNIEAESEIFYKSQQVILYCTTPNSKIHYTLDGSNPDHTSTLYDSPILLTDATTIKCIAYTDRDNSSSITSAKFIKSLYPPAKYKEMFDDRYTGGGTMALTDGRFGTENFQNGEWQGFEGVNLESVIDLEKEKIINRVSLNSLNDPNVWIFMPRKVIFEVSENGTDFIKIAEIENDLAVETTQLMIKKFDTEKLNVSARYIKVFAESIKICPLWHKGAGYKSWIFVDEITIE
ncbi:MAG: GH92 family glycosyl hydrolase [Melioribacteraceae bacterium]|nr:GH92 family glycosyl hydrolase [Melioribacteraceae bacterium]